MRGYFKPCLDCGTRFNGYHKNHKRCKICAAHQYALERYGDLSDKVCQVCDIIFQPTKSTQKFCVICGKHSVRTMRAHWAKTPAQRHLKFIRAKYKLSIEEYDKLILDSNGECGICKRTDLELVVDHDHKTYR